MSSAAVTPNNNMNGNTNKSLSPLEAAAVVAAGGSNANAANSPQGQLPQQALQNLQRILQSQLANVNPIHLQQALQRHQQQQMVDAGRKQLEQMLQQLQEQLQLNLLQQTHLSTTSNGKQSLHSLQQQQHQLMAQIQLTQQALMLGQTMDNESGLLKEAITGSKKERERHASETTLASSEGSLKENQRSENLVPKQTNGDAPKSPIHSPISSNNDNAAAVEKLFNHGHCSWPGCDTSLPDSASFFRHLTRNHCLDDKSTAQTRVQMQIVSQLELQLRKEKDRLNGMMKHLQLEQTKSGELKKIQDPLQMLQTSVDRASSDQAFSSKHHHEASKAPLPAASAISAAESNSDLTSRMAAMAAMFPNLPTSIAATLGFPSTQSLPSPLSALNAAVQRNSNPLIDRMERSANLPSNSSTPIRPKISSQPTTTSATITPISESRLLPLPPGFDERRGRGDRGNPNLDPEMDIQQNREFYMHNDVRPPYTYAALIRYAIHESPDQQLTLHEIYNWFTVTFAYFRRNAASWKNAVRHNLSLHKCFMRVENVKGAVWTVDDEEYYKRRPPRGVGASPSPGNNQSPTLTPQTPSIIDQNLTSMFAAAAAAASGGSRAGTTRFPSNLFTNNKRPSGLESPPQSLENRSTPGSLDLSRSKEDYLEDMDSSDMPPTMVKMEAMVYPKVDSEEDEECQTRLEKRIFQSDDDDDEDNVQDLSSKKPKLDPEEINVNLKPGENNNSSDEKLVKSSDNLRVRDEFKEQPSSHHQEENEAS